MGDPKKRRKKYETPRKRWDKQLLDSERKLVEFYGLANKKDLRKHTTWLKNKRQTARGLLALPLEERTVREKELMSGLRKYGLANKDTTVEEVLSLKVEAVLERRLQTQAMRRGMANTPKQARQFIVHGHIALDGKKITAPSYLVSAEETGAISWYGKPIHIEAEKKKDLKKEFEEAAGNAAKETGEAEAAEKAGEQAENEGAKEESHREKQEEEAGEKPAAGKEEAKEGEEQKESPKKKETEGKDETMQEGSGEGVKA